MKIVLSQTRFLRHALLAAIVSCVGLGLSQSHAQPVVPTPVAPTQPAAVPQVQTPGIDVSPSASAPSAPSVLPVPAAPVAAAAQEPEKPRDPNALPTQVEDVMKKLRDSDVDMTLEDMNQARAALARLDLLVNIEEKLTDLETARRKRQEAVGISALIPASALGARGGMPTPISPMPMQQASMPMMQESYTVKRVIGTDGDYEAMVEIARDRTMTVRLNDTLPDGSRVIGITQHGVRVKTDGSEKMLRISTINPSSAPTPTPSRVSPR